MTDFLSLFKLAFHLDFCERFISLFQTIMEKRIIGESRDTVVFNAEHSACFQLYIREGIEIQTPSPFRATSTLLLHWMLSDVFKYLLYTKYKDGKSFHEI